MFRMVCLLLVLKLTLFVEDGIRKAPKTMFGCLTNDVDKCKCLFINLS